MTTLPSMTMSPFDPLMSSSSPSSSFSAFGANVSNSARNGDKWKKRFEYAMESAWDWARKRD